MQEEMRPSKFYKGLFEAFAEAGWEFPKDLDNKRIAVFANQLNAIEKTERYELDKVWFDYHVKYGGLLSNWYSLNTSLKCQFGVEGMGKTLENFSIIPKKVVAYSGTSLFSTSQMIDYHTVVSFPGHYYQSLLSLRPLLESDMAIILPSRMQVEDDHPASTFRFYLQDFYDVVYKRESSDIYVSLGSQDFTALTKQLFELEELDWLSGMPTLLLPAVKGLELDDMIRIRQNDPTSFSAYQSAIKSFLKELTVQESEKKLYEVIQYVSDTIISYQNCLSKETKVFKKTGFDVAVGLVACLVVLHVPQNWARAIAALFGSKPVYESVRYLMRDKSDTSILNSDFAFAWNLARVAKNFPTS